MPSFLPCWDRLRHHPTASPNTSITRHNGTCVSIPTASSLVCHIKLHIRLSQFLQHLLVRMCEAYMISSQLAIHTLMATVSYTKLMTVTLVGTCCLRAKQQPLGPNANTEQK